MADFKWSSARFRLNQTVDPDLPRIMRPDPIGYTGPEFRQNIPDNVTPALR